jgi:hypothetical protein
VSAASYLSKDGLTRSGCTVQGKPRICSADCRHNKRSCRTAGTTSYTSASASRGDTTAPTLTFISAHRPPPRANRRVNSQDNRNHYHIPAEKETQLRTDHRNTRQAVQSLALPGGNRELLLEQFSGFLKWQPSGVNGAEAPHPQPRKGQTPTASKSRIRQTAAAPFKVTLDPELRDVTVTRQYLKAQFGAFSFHPFAKIPRGLVEEHGYDHFIFMHSVRPSPRGMLSIHLHAELKRSTQVSTPQVPSAPGKPGVVARFKEKPWPELELSRVFVRVRELPPRWQYMGLYKATRLPAWTPNEVQRQRPRVRPPPLPGGHPFAKLRY